MAVFALVGGHFTPDRRVLWRFCSRGARTNPSSPGEPVLERSEPARKGERVAVLEARKQYCWYLKGIPHANYYKEQIVQMNTLEDVDRITKGIQRDLRD